MMQLESSRHQSMKNTKLQDFIAKTAATSRIIFGDVRRLQRDILPDGISTREQAELLVRLDGQVRRADRAWTEWLVEAVVDFAVWDERAIGAVRSESREWLKGLLEATGTPTKAGRNIAREIRREAERAEPAISFAANEDSAAAQASRPNAIQGTMSTPHVAA
jgi:hypothetical protein